MTRTAACWDVIDRRRNRVLHSTGYGVAVRREPQWSLCLNCTRRDERAICMRRPSKIFSALGADYYLFFLLALVSFVCIFNSSSCWAQSNSGGGRGLPPPSELVGPIYRRSDGSIGLKAAPKTTTGRRVPNAPAVAPIAKSLVSAVPSSPKSSAEPALPSPQPVAAPVLKQSQHDQWNAATCMVIAWEGNPTNKCLEKLGRSNPTPQKGRDPRAKQK